MRFLLFCRVLLLLWLLSFVDLRPAAHDSGEDPDPIDERFERSAAATKRLSLEEHLRYVHGRPCSTPAPRFLLAKKIHGLKHLRISSVRPIGTIVYRCKQCGYCSSVHEKCMATRWEEVSVEFLINQTVYKSVKMRNDTQCACTTT